MSFTDLRLDKKLLTTIEHAGYQQPTEIQQMVIPHALSGQDIMAASKTGSGKTLAFVLPMLNRLLNQKAYSKQDARALVLAPTRELTKQVYGEVKHFTANTQLKAVLIVGGENFNDQAKKLARNPHIIVATPGRMADHLDHRHCFLNGLELLILDEADRMLDLGFDKQIQQINAAADHRKRQTMLFSATLADSEVNELAQNLLSNPKKIYLDPVYQNHSNIQQKHYLADDLAFKQQLLQKVFAEYPTQQTIIFTATREHSETLAAQLTSLGLNATALHGQMPQNQRNQKMTEFSQRQFQILVTTDLASRGLDINNVELVINFDMPKLAEEYVHRIGRTGRGENKGTAISFIGPKDWRNFEAVQHLLKQTFNFDEFDNLKPSFKGLAKQDSKPKSKINEKHNPKVNLSKKHKPTKRNKSFYGAVDIGDAPLMKKKK